MNKKTCKDEKIKEKMKEEVEQEVTGTEEESSEEKKCENTEEKKEEFSNEELLKTIEERDSLIVLLQDKLQRQMAEFDNFRKRTEKEKIEMFDVGASDVLKKLLSIVDNFERGFSMIPENEEKTQFAVGMDMIYKQLVKLLEENKVTPIKALGEVFDPILHNAVSHIEKEDVGENIIVEEYEKGYKYKENVLRHSMVIVAN